MRNLENRGEAKSMRKLRGRFPLNACECKGRVKFRVDGGNFYVYCVCGRGTVYAHPTPAGAQKAWNRIYKTT